MNDWFSVVCTNKDGNGDSSGTIPDDALDATFEFFLGRLPRATTQEQQDAYVTHFQTRCECGYELEYGVPLLSSSLRRHWPLLARNRKSRRLVRAGRAVDAHACEYQGSDSHLDRRDGHDFVH